MGRGVQRGFQELSNAGQDSPTAEGQRSTPLVSSPGVTTAPHPGPAAESFEEFYKSVPERAHGGVGASENSTKPAKPPKLPAPSRAQVTSTPGSKVVLKSLSQSARKELLAPKVKKSKT